MLENPPQNSRLQRGIVSSFAPETKSPLPDLTARTLVLHLPPVMTMVSVLPDQPPSGTWSPGALGLGGWGPSSSSSSFSSSSQTQSPACRAPRPGVPPLPQQETCGFRLLEQKSCWEERGGEACEGFSSRQSPGWCQTWSRAVGGNRGLKPSLGLLVATGQQSPIAACPDSAALPLARETVLF